MPYLELHLAIKDGELNCIFKTMPRYLSSSGGRPFVLQEGSVEMIWHPNAPINLPILLTPASAEELGRALLYLSEEARKNPKA